MMWTLSLRVVPPEGRRVRAAPGVPAPWHSHPLASSVPAARVCPLPGEACAGTGGTGALEPARWQGCGVKGELGLT